MEDNNTLLYWVWLSLCIGAEADVKKILRAYHDVTNIHADGDAEREARACFTAGQRRKLNEMPLAEAQRMIDTCRRNDWQIVTLMDERYPALLREIQRPPLLLYVQGNTDALADAPCIAMVGTRKAGGYAKQAAHYLGFGLSKGGATVVSGGALGVDSASHEGALEAGGKTVAVLGCGFGADYLKSNDALRQQIVRQGGALVTEYPPYTPANHYHFPVRNRIISGMSKAVIVVEAAEKSGSLITASCAKKQGRDVFALPASILDPAFQGTNRLIEDGAFVATSAAAVLAHYADAYEGIRLQQVPTPYECQSAKRVVNAPEKPQITFDAVAENRHEETERQQAALKLTGYNKTVYDAMSDDPISGDQLIRATKLPAGKVLAALTMLDMFGLIERVEGGRYRKL